MTIYEIIETCWLERHALTDNIMRELVDTIPDDQWHRACVKFLRGIGSRHQVRGRVVHTMMGMCDWYSQVGEYTVKQRRWILERLIDNWDQMSCESRAEMCL